LECCQSLVGFVPLVGSGIAATAKWGSKAFKASKIGSKVIGVGSKVLDFGKTIGKGIAHNASLARSVWKASKSSKKFVYASMLGGGEAQKLYERLTKAVDKFKDLKKAAARAGKAIDEAALARKWQGSGAYPGVDDWTNITIKKGTKVWGGAPGQSNFYTTEEVMQAVGNDATKLNQGLHVGKGNYPQFRPGMTQYEVTQDSIVGYSKALANPQYGAGGFDQYYISNYESILKPIKSTIMTNR